MGMMIASYRLGTMLCVTLSLLLIIIDAASIPAGHQLQVIYDHELANDYHQLDHHTVLPRKLLMVQRNSMVEGSEPKSLVSSNKQNKDSSGELHKKRKEVEVVMVHAAKGTRQEWMEASDQSTTLDFFTMDYSHVRRRRPIHNKSFPKTAMNNSP